MSKLSITLYTIFVLLAIVLIVLGVVYNSVLCYMTAAATVLFICAGLVLQYTVTNPPRFLSEQRPLERSPSTVPNVIMSAPRTLPPLRGRLPPLSPSYENFKKSADTVYEDAHNFTGSSETI